MTERQFSPVNVSPYATNVLDLCGIDTLSTRDGKKVLIYHGNYGFDIYVDGNHAYSTGDNLSASYYLNQIEIGYL